MNKRLRLIIAAAVVLIVVIGAYFWMNRQKTLSLEEASQGGLITLSIRGQDVENMQVSITANSPMTIVIPAGTLFNPDGGDAQQMVAATDTRVVFAPGGPQTQNVDVEVFCINRFKDAPTDAMGYSAGHLPDGDPILELVHCLEQQDAPHRAKQLAIWIVSDHLMDKDLDAVAEEIVDHAFDKLRQGGIQALLSAPGAPAMPQQAIDLLKKMTPEQQEELLQQLRPGMVADERKDLEDYRTQGGPLLQHCGYDLNGKPFFQGADTSSTPDGGTSAAPDPGTAPPPP